MARFSPRQLVLTCRRDRAENPGPFLLVTSRHLTDSSGCAMSPLQLLTLVVPTRNCPIMLNRTIGYLARIGFRGRVLILDSSDGVARQMNLVTVTRHGAELDIGLLHFDKTYLQKCRAGMGRVVTPYSALCADDAFIFSDALGRLVEFLELNSGYSAAAGIRVSLSREPNGKCYAMPGRPILNDSPVVRFRDFASNPFPLGHAVQRTDGLIEAFDVAATSTDYEATPVFAEIVLNQMPVMLGRIHFEPLAAHVRVDRGRNPTVMPIVFDAERCATQFQAFREGLAEQLEIAGATIDHSFVMVDRYYGDLWDGGARAASRRLGVFGRCRRETVRHYRQLVNLIRADHLLQRRRLRTADLKGQRPEWLLMHDLLAHSGPEPILIDAAAQRKAA